MILTEWGNMPFIEPVDTLQKAITKNALNWLFHGAELYCWGNAKISSNIPVYIEIYIMYI